MIYENKEYQTRLIENDVCLSEEELTKRNGIGKHIILPTFSFHTSL